MKYGIKIFRVFTEKSTYKLNPVELYFYCILTAMESTYINCTITTLNILLDEQIIYKDMNRSRNTNNIKNILFKLKDMGIINIEHIDKLSLNSKLKITFNFLEKGYDIFPYELYSLSNSADELYIMATINKFNNTFGKPLEKSKEQWSSLLGYSSKNTGYNIVSNMVNSGKIYCIEGEYYKDNQGRLKQKPTQWFISKNEKLSEDDVDIIETERLHGWYNKDKEYYPNLNDYVVYLTTKNKEILTDKDKELINQAEFRMNNLKKSNFGKQKVEENLKEARLYIDTDDYDGDIDNDNIENEKDVSTNINTPVKFKYDEMVNPFS